MIKADLAKNQTYKLDQLIFIFIILLFSYYHFNIQLSFRIQPILSLFPFRINKFNCFYISEYS